MISSSMTWRSRYPTIICPLEIFHKYGRTEGQEGRRKNRSVIRDLTWDRTAIVNLCTTWITPGIWTLMTRMSNANLTARTSFILDQAPPARCTNDFISRISIKKSLFQGIKIFPENTKKRLSRVFQAIKGTGSRSHWESMFPNVHVCSLHHVKGHGETRGRYSNFLKRKGKNKLLTMLILHKVEKKQQKNSAPTCSCCYLLQLLPTPQWDLPD